MLENPGINLELAKQKLQQLSPQVETLVDADKQISVRLGIPELNRAIIVNDKPHVLIADKLVVNDKKNAEHGKILENVVVMMGHGVRDENDNWKFVGGRKVSETVSGYNKYADKQGLPGVEFLAVCNRDKLTSEIGVSVEESDIGKGTAYAAGTEVEVMGIVENDGQVFLYVKSKENMFNLENLETIKQITFV